MSKQTICIFFVRRKLKSCKPKYSHFECTGRFYMESEILEQKSNIIVITPKHQFSDALQIEFLDRGFLIGKRYYRYSNIIEVTMCPSYGGRYTCYDLCILYGIEQNTRLYSTRHDQSNGSENERNRATEQYKIMNEVYDTLVQKRDSYVRRKR